MTNEQINEISNILGLSAEIIPALDDGIQNEMQALSENSVIKSDDDSKSLYDALEKLWVRGAVYVDLQDVADGTGIPYVTLRNLDFETQQNILCEYMMDTTKEERIYKLMNDALAVRELDKVAKLISVPVSKLKKMSVDDQKRICGAYAMEYDESSTNAELINIIREMIDT